jgi:hypothetical protein
MTYTTGGNTSELLVTLAYLPYDSDIPLPSKGLREVTDYCNTNKMQFIIGCDTKAHYIMWGSMDINPQGECLMEHLISKKLNSLIQAMNLTQFMIGWLPT